MADIKQIKTSDGSLYDIDAKKWNGHTFDEVTNLIHGVVDTYVIPTTKSSTTGYAGVVTAASTQISTTVGTLKGLVSNPPSNSFDNFNIGDIVLMGATSDGTNNFDRWISSVSGTGDSAVVTLDVLETQVAKHHHTVSITTTSRRVLTGVSTSSFTSTNVAKVGTAVNVLTGESGSYVTSVDINNDGTHNLAIATGTSTDGVGHKHTVNSHNHSVSITPTALVSRSIMAYTGLDTSSHTPHTHTIVSAAGKSTDGSAFTFVTGGGTGTFIQSLKDATSTTNTGNATPGTGANTAGLTTSTQASTDTIGEVVKTTSGGTHKHTVTATTTTSVVTAATVQTSVVTSAKLNYTAPSVQASVVTSAKLTYTAPTVQANVVTSWTCSVDGNGILSFNSPSASQSAGSASLDAPRGSQSAGSTSLDAPRGSQSRTYGAPTISVTCGDAGSHQHGFSHTHAIPSHTHTVDAHSHTYYKTIASATGSAYTSLNTSTHTPHTHSANVGVAGTATNATAITFVTGGTTTSVVRDMKGSAQTLTTTSASPETDTKYYKLSGTITFPGLTVGQKTLSTTSITPAADGGAKALTGITFTSASVVKTVTSGTINTGVNIGGE